MSAVSGPRPEPGAAVPGGSVFLQALGAEAARLHPEVRRYAAGSGVVGGAVAVTGEFEVAGSRWRKLNLFARPLVGPHLFVTAFELDVPFQVVNTVVWDNGGGLGLGAERVFRFSSGDQRFVDVLRPGETPGTLRNLLGSARRVELELRCSVTDAGHLRLVSERAWLRLGRLRVRLPALLSVRAEVVDGYDDVAGRNIVDASVRSPLLGTVLEYRGAFRHEPAS
ncbi:DUF4166 domain-containing protein [Leucobacter sp. G161]|uniref:DUF4166 domain-containing protein n=1 Tax=Leucobacter sp. G161 TaxID=663704 RepID=UPI00073C4F05|nr:DUF4166 domain-containing protein [Leucobacter sp. G161]KUF08141.1 hypothetical protein AUL38_05235 [Leucobacter sp. G161]